jgi:transposase
MAMCGRVAYMPKQIDFTLTEEQAMALASAIKQDKRPRVVRRATAVRLLHLGYRVAEVATTVSASAPIIYAWHRRFLAQGVEGLANKTKQVGRRKVTDAYIAALEEALGRTPADYGYEFAIWTRERLRDHLAQETGIYIHINWIGELLKARGYVLRRPKHDLRHRQDPVAKAEAEETLKELKKTQAQTISGSSLWTKPH